MTNNKMPLVSIITPSYNSEKFISETIISIQKQTYNNWELLITDDCSTDKTLKIVRSYLENDNRIKLFKLEANKGAGVARNNSIEKATGRFIAFLDSDDQWKPNKLEIQLSFMIKNKYDFTCSGFDVIDEAGKFIETTQPPGKLTFHKLLINNYVGCLTAIYDTKSLGKIYMPLIRNRQDWILWLGILKKIKVAFTINEPLAIYRKRSGSISSNKIKMIRFHWIVYYKELNFGFFRSIFYLFNNLLFHFFKKYI